MLGNLNINLAALRNKRDETIAELMDTMALIDISSPLLSVAWETIPGSMDVADEEGEILDLLSV